MAQGLAVSVFSSKPTDSLLAVDAYEQNTATEKVTAVKDILSEELGAGLKSINSLAIGLKAEGALGLKLPESLAIDAKAALSDAVGQSTAAMSAFNSMASSAKSALLSGINKDLINATGLGRVTATLNGSITKIASTDLTSLKGLGTLVGGLSNAPYALKLTDPKSMSVVASNIMKQATIKGLPDAFKAFSDGTSDKSILGRVTKDLLPTIVSTGNVNTLYNIATGKTKASVKAFMPSFAMDYVKAFKNPGKMSVGQVSSLMRTVGSSMTAIDSKWDKWITPKGNDLLNMNVCMKGSSDFQTAIKRTAEAMPVTRVSSPGPADIGAKFMNDATSSMSAMMSMFSSDKQTEKKKVYVKDDGSNNLGLFGLGVFASPGKNTTALQAAYEKAAAQRLSQETAALWAKAEAEKKKPALDANAADRLAYDFGDVVSNM